MTKAKAKPKAKRRSDIDPDAAVSVQLRELSGLIRKVAQPAEGGLVGDSDGRLVEAVELIDVTGAGRFDGTVRAPAGIAEGDWRPCWEPPAYFHPRFKEAVASVYDLLREIDKGKHGPDHKPAPHPFIGDAAERLKVLADELDRAVKLAEGDSPTLTWTAQMIEPYLKAEWEYRHILLAKAGLQDTRVSQQALAELVRAGVAESRKGRIGGYRRKR